MHNVKKSHDKEMDYLSSIESLDVAEHACGTPLIIEVYVLHAYPLKG